MMLRDVPVIDAVVHGGEQEHTAQALVSLCFGESATDVAVYHTVRRNESTNNAGSSPWDVALRFRELAGPERVRIMAGLTDPWDTKRSIDELDEMIDACEVIGVTLCPWDRDDREQGLRAWSIDDEEVGFPLIEHCQKRRVRALAIGKAIGSAMTEARLAGAAMAFPDMQFEIILAGWASLEAIDSLAQTSNVYFDLDGTASLLHLAPRRFAEILGRFLRPTGAEPGAEDRILWATGVTATHPQPLIELFWNFQMPEDLMEGSDYPEVTEEIKRKILAGNYCRKNGLDLGQLIDAIPNDDMRQAQQAGDYAEPWSRVPQHAPEIRP